MVALDLVLSGLLLTVAEGAAGRLLLLSLPDATTSAAVTGHDGEVAGRLSISCGYGATHKPRRGRTHSKVRWRWHCQNGQARRVVRDRTPGLAGADT